MYIVSQTCVFTLLSIQEPTSYSQLRERYTDISFHYLASNLQFAVKFLSVNIFLNRSSILTFFSFRDILCKPQIIINGYYNFDLCD